MLWIGIHLSQLPLETLLRGSLRPEAWAVTERERILLADRKARARGIREGMLSSAALALAPQLRLRERDAPAETESLLGIAAWVAQFTPSVALDFPAALVLEIEGSLKIFGGLEKVLAQLREGLAAMGFTADLAVAPTPRAASWLARSKASPTSSAKALAPITANALAPLTDPALLASALDTLPVSLLRCGEDTLEALTALGVSTMADLAALPRDGLARRFGQALRDELDQALGRLPDPRTWFVLPPKFHVSLELPAEVAYAEALLFAGQRLLAQLEGYLVARSGGVQRFVLRLAHRDGPATEVTVGLVEPSRDAAHFTLLLREQLGRLKLREPVRAISLEAAGILPLAGATQNLLAEDKARPGDWPRLIERLRSRLGNEAVHSVAAAADHRPEKASRKAEPGQKQMKLELPHAPGERPFWLLEEPRPLDEIGAAPHYRVPETGGSKSSGPLTLLAGPERIETGWWDGEEAGRDYFIARAPDESLVWVYRSHALQGRWYLHGLFA